MHKEEEHHLREHLPNHSTTDTGINDLALTSNWIRRTGFAPAEPGIRMSSIFGPGKCTLDSLARIS